MLAVVVVVDISAVQCHINEHEIRDARYKSNEGHFLTLDAPHRIQILLETLQEPLHGPPCGCVTFILFLLFEFELYVCITITSKSTKMQMKAHDRSVVNQL